MCASCGLVKEWKKGFEICRSLARDFESRILDFFRGGYLRYWSNSCHALASTIEIYIQFSTMDSCKLVARSSEWATEMKKVVSSVWKRRLMLFTFC